MLQERCLRQWTILINLSTSTPSSPTTQLQEVQLPINNDRAHLKTNLAHYLSLHMSQSFNHPVEDPSFADLLLRYQRRGRSMRALTTIVWQTRQPSTDPKQRFDYDWTLVEELLADSVSSP